MVRFGYMVTWLQDRPSALGVWPDTHSHIHFSTPLGSLRRSLEPSEPHSPPVKTWLRDGPGRDGP